MQNGSVFPLSDTPPVSFADSPLFEGAKAAPPFRIPALDSKFCLNSHLYIGRLCGTIYGIYHHSRRAL